ncbi:MAG: hypothetical protein MUF50_03320 [Planctomycetes bacterium]|jgi:hypothetical protein|nr:hypothetical protein [Planctomycetota bacterium]
MFNNLIFKEMENIKEITVFIYAGISSSGTLYGVYSVDSDSIKDEQSLIGMSKKMDCALWDGVPGSGVSVADDMYPSLKELVGIMSDGFAELAQAGVERFKFYFDIPDTLGFNYFSLNKENPHFRDMKKIKIECLERNRPLNEQERQEFFFLLSKLEPKE